MASISVDRVIRSLDSYSDNELTKLHRALDSRLDDSNKQISTDDLEVFQTGTSGVINTLRQQRDRYKAQLEFYETYFPKEWIAYIDGKDVDQGQTQIGIALMLHDGGRKTNVALLEGVTPMPLQESLDNITTGLFNIIGLIPEAADMGGQQLAGLSLNDWKQIFSELTQFRYTESLKSRFSEKQAALFGLYYPQIQTVRTELGLTDEPRGKTQDHFNKIIKRTFEKREGRSSLTKFIVREITD